jgi:hypothetical protein
MYIPCFVLLILLVLLGTIVGLVSSRVEWLLQHISVWRCPKAIELIASYSRITSKMHISLVPKDYIKKDVRLCRLDSLGLDVVISINKGWFKDISQYISGESSKEEVDYLFTFLDISCLSA